MPSKPNEFSLKVFKLVRAIPRGKVATYGLIARLAGKPQGARGVGWLLHSSSRRHKLPWQRVLNSQGRISFDTSSTNFVLQKRRLESEGIEFTNDRVDLKKFLWNKKVKKKARSSRRPSIFD